MLCDWQKRAESVIAQGALTYSKRSDQFVKGIFPTHLKGGRGCHVTAADGKRYVDFCGGLGSNLLGCDNNFSLPTIYEVELAEKIRARIPCCEKLRILKTGSEGCQAAVRIARAYTGKKLVLGVGYHGHHSVFISAEKPGAGTFYEEYIKYPSIMDLLATDKRNIAAVIVEPVQLDINVRDELLKLREFCTRREIVLIFDEVITGFRVPMYCVANYLGVQPDIMVMGKAMASGWPLAVVGGKKEIMDTPGWFVSSTFAGEISSIKRALKVIKYVTPERIGVLWMWGRFFQEKFNAISPAIQLKGIPTKAVFVGDELTKNLFWQEMCKRGYLFFKAWHITFAHIKRTFWQWLFCRETTIDRTLRVCREVIKEIEAGNVKLEGELCKEVFVRHEVKNEP
jgi:glutamate-1-semialdehyde 2,1-aminomutase